MLCLYRSSIKLAQHSCELLGFQISTDRIKKNNDLGLKLDLSELLHQPLGQKQDNSVKLNSLDVQCFTYCNLKKMKYVGGELILFSPSSHSKWFPMTSPRFTE